MLKEMMGFVRRGDIVVVESISRFARNTRDLLSWSINWLLKECNLSA